jgi:hypothetical protein
MSAAADILRQYTPDKPLYGEDSGERAGWFTVSVAPARSGEINKSLADAGIYATGLEPGSDLESIFLELTGSGANVHDRPETPGHQPSPMAPPTEMPPS